MVNCTGKQFLHRNGHRKRAEDKEHDSQAPLIESYLRCFPPAHIGVRWGKAQGTWGGKEEKARRSCNTGKTSLFAVFNWGRQVFRK
jgi:hypothetical protein